MKKTILPPQYDQIVALLRDTGAFLVGGAVRDRVLERPIHDLDFALPEQTIPAAKRVADRLGGGFFVLDEERQTCRVILNHGSARRLVVDFTLFQGDSIEEDLARRDFTITSMALDIGGQDAIIDPFHGLQDLKDGLIRATGPGALADDPLRCLRAVRLAAQLGFHILPETRDQIRLHRHKLVDISRERIRDELFRLLEGPGQAAGMASLQTLELYQYILPGDLSPGASRMLRHLEAIWSLFIHDHDQDRAASWSRGLLVHRLGRFRESLRGYLAEEMVPDRSLYQLSFLLALLYGGGGAGDPGSSTQIINQLALSNQEASFLEKGARAGEYWLKKSDLEGHDQPVEVYRFFNQFGKAGVSAIFLALCDALENHSGGETQDSWIQVLENARFYLEGYWEHSQEWVEPPSLLDGNEIQRGLGLSPGPQVGSLLAALREEQVRRGGMSREEGMDFLRGLLSQPEKGGGE